MMHGVVMKITEQCIVILCEDGKFRNIPHLSVMPSLGERIAVPDVPVALKPNKKQIVFHKGWIAAASVLLVICAAFLMQTNRMTAHPVALVAIDINPSVELLVDAGGRVEHAELVNDDAQWLLSEKELAGKDVYEAIQSIVSKAEEQGYLDANTNKKHIFISIVELKKNSFQVDTERLVSSTKKYEMELQHANEHQMEKAEQTGLTLNKYIVYEYAKQKGINLNMVALRTRSIVTTLDLAGIDREQFFDEEIKQASPTSSSLPSEAEESKETEAAAETHDPAGGHTIQSQHLEKQTPKYKENDNKHQIASADQPANNDSVQQTAKEENDRLEGANIREFSLKVELIGEEKIKLMYKISDGKTEVRIEKESKQGKEQLTDDQALQYVSNIMDQLAISENMSKDGLSVKVLSVMQLPKDRWKSIDINVEFSSGKEVEFESENSELHNKEKDEIVDEEKEVVEEEEEEEEEDESEDDDRRDDDNKDLESEENDD